MFKIKYSTLILLYLTIVAKVFATQEQSYYFYYHSRSVSGTSERIEYLEPVLFYSWKPEDLKHKAEIIMGRLSNYNQVFKHTELKVENKNLTVQLKINNLSVTARQELITSLLLNGFEYVTVVVADTERTYSIKDINIPFFLPIYFFDGLSGNSLFFEKAVKLLHIYELYGYTYTHRVEQGQTVYGISRQYGITQDHLKDLNPELKNRQLQTGQDLIIDRYKPRVLTIVSNNTKKEGNKTCDNLKKNFYIALGLSVLINVILLLLLLKKKK